MLDVGAVLSEVHNLADRSRHRGAEIEAAGQLPADLVADLRASGIFRLWLPVEVGGYEADPAQVLQIVQLLAEADGSTGWCAATGIASNIVAALLPEDVARRLLATGLEQCGGALMPGGRAVRRPDGNFEVTGRWRFGSGTQHCDWVVGGVLVDGAEPGLRAAVLPRAGVEFIDTWQVLGLRATASVDYQVQALQIPAEQLIDLATVTPWPAGSMWRIPLRSLLYPIVAAVPLGIARRALAELVAMAGSKQRFGSSRPLAEREVIQAEVARATATLAGASAYLSEALQALRVAADSGRAPDAAERACARLAAVYAAEQACKVVETCYRAAGTAAIYQDSVLQRALRDVNTASQHYALSASGYELTGRVLLGLGPDPLL